MAKYTRPNWAQALIIREVGLDPRKVSVCNDNDRTLSLLQHNPRKQILVNKVDGSKIEHMDPYADKPKTAPVRKVAGQINLLAQM